MLTKGQKWLQKAYPIGGEEGEDKNKEGMEDKERSCKLYGGHMCLVQPFSWRCETWMPHSALASDISMPICVLPWWSQPIKALKERPRPHFWGPSWVAQGCPKLRLPHSCWPASALQGTLLIVLTFCIEELKVPILTTEIINDKNRSKCCTDQQICFPRT